MKRKFKSIRPEKTVMVAYEEGDELREAISEHVRKGWILRDAPVEKKGEKEGSCPS